MGSIGYTVRLLVGTAVLLVYGAAAYGGVVLLQWLFSDPPSPLTVALLFGVFVLVAGFLGYRLGVTRIAANLEARRLSRRRTPEVHRRLDRLSQRMGVDVPPLLVADLGTPNALSIGGARRGAIVLDYDLFSLLTIDELEGILAHELAHLESYHTFVNTIVLTAVRMVVGLVFLLLFPVVLFLTGLDRATAWFAGRPGERHFGLAALFQLTVQLFVSVVLSLLTLLFLAHARRQEFAADRRAAEATDNPLALARALSKIHRATRTRGSLRSLLYIHDERTEERSRWLSTHPPVDDRIDRLLELADVEARGRRRRVSLLRPRGEK
jgi:heat shock protein HtpX